MERSRNTLGSRVSRVISVQLIVPHLLSAVCWNTHNVQGWVMTKQPVSCSHNRMEIQSNAGCKRRAESCLWPGMDRSVWACVRLSVWTSSWQRSDSAIGQFRPLHRSRGIHWAQRCPPFLREGKKIITSNYTVEYQADSALIAISSMGIIQPVMCVWVCACVKRSPVFTALCQIPVHQLKLFLSVLVQASFHEIGHPLLKWNRRFSVEFMASSFCQTW